MPTTRPPPDLSPTTSSFLSATNPATTASVRRNLFSGHLSRRPVTSGSQDEAQMPQPVVAPPPPAPSRRIHQRSASTPSLSPSPPRLSPTNHYQPGNGMNSPVFAHPLLQPTQSPPRTSLLDTYDPTVSPNRPLSPRSTATLFPNSSIIAVNPLTGRPVLPHLPVLPGRLKLSDSDDEGLEVVETGRTGEPEHGDPSRSYESYTHSPTADADYAHQAAMAAAAAEAEAEAEADEERRTRERIERMLKDMMARQRARVKHTSPAATNIPAPPPRRSRICRRAQARTRLQRQPSPDIDPDLEVDPTGYRMEHRDDEAHSPTYPEPDVDAESDAEKEELMSLITASLRKEVTRADEEAWMFGDPGGIDPTFD